MNLERLDILVQVSETLPPQEFTTQDWVQVPKGYRPPRTGAAKPPPGSRYTLVGALPRCTHDWCWMGVPDPLDEEHNTAVVPCLVWSSLWTPQTGILARKSDDLRAALGVWYMVAEWLECGPGLAEVLVGNVTDEALRQDLPGCAAVLRRARALGNKLDECPEHVAEALSWLFA